MRAAFYVAKLEKYMDKRGEKMQTITIPQIEKRLRKLTSDKLAVVFDFVSYLTEQSFPSESFQTMLASERVLRQDWEKQEEEAWAHL